MCGLVKEGGEPATMPWGKLWKALKKKRVPTGPAWDPKVVGANTSETDPLAQPWVSARRTKSRYPQQSTDRITVQAYRLAAQRLAPTAV